MTNTRKEEIRDQINLYMEDEAFVTAVLSAGEPEKMTDVLRNKGIQVETGEVAELMQEGCEQLEAMSEEGELTEEQLLEVSGGGARGVLTCIGFCVGGVAVGAGLGLFAAAGVITMGSAYAIGVGYAAFGGLVSASADKKKKKKRSSLIKESN